MTVNAGKQSLISSTKSTRQPIPTNDNLSEIALPALVSMIQQLLTNFPRYALAAFLHRTELSPEDTLIFDRRNAWATAIYKDVSNYIVFMKASQIGATVMMICEMMAQLMDGVPGIYVLPTDRWSNLFVKNRIDPMIQNTPFYRKNYAKRKMDASGAELKTLFQTRVKFAGASVKNNFHEMPAGWYIIDENDLCNQDNLKYLDDRLKRQQVKVKRKIGNPSFSDVGIDAEYKKSNMQEWFLKHDCGHWQVPTWTEHCVRQIDNSRYVLRDRKIQKQVNDLSRSEKLVNALDMIAQLMESIGTDDANIYCNKCHKPLDRHGKGEWVAKHPDRPISGYQMGQIVGDINKGGAIVRLLHGQVEALHDPGATQHWINTGLGMPYDAEGNRITETLINKSVAAYEWPFKLPFDYESQKVSWSVAGIDVGTGMNPELFVNVSGLLRIKGEICRIKLFIGKVTGLIELEDLMDRYNVVAAVIDAMPETRLARTFCRRKAGRYMSWFTESWGTKEFKYDQEEKSIKCNRTEQMDASYAAWEANRVIITPDFRSIDGGEFLQSMIGPVRATEERKGSIVPFWQKKPNDDYRLSDTYEFMATNVPAAIPAEAA